MLRRWRGVRASVWMLWLGSVAVATAAVVALLVLHSGGAATGVPPVLQIQRSGVPLSVAPETTTSITQSTTVATTVIGVTPTSPPTSTSPKIIVVAPRQTVSEGDSSGSGSTDAGSPGGAKSTTGNTVPDH